MYMDLDPNKSKAQLGLLICISFGDYNNENHNSRIWKYVIIMKNQLEINTHIEHAFTERKCRHIHVWHNLESHDIT